MKIIVAKNAGFCPGVNDAIKKVIELSQKTTKKIYTFGPLIHNNDVIKNLKERGIESINDIKEIKDPKNSILVIRAHGVPPKIEEEIRNSGIEVVDATCPLVKNVHNTITKYSKKGYTTIILGDPEHAEVIGLKGYAGENYFIITSEEDARRLPNIEKANLVSQTTQEEELFFKIVKIIRTKVSELIISNTICTPTKLRQKETIEFSRISDLVIIIGGKHSANTQRLYQITKTLSKKSILVENENEITPEIFENVNLLFITAGASTPGWMIERVEKKIKEMVFREKKFIKLFRVLVSTGIFTGFAAFGLISLVYKSFKNHIEFPLASAIAISVMVIHIINRNLEKEFLEDNIKKMIFLKYSKEIKYFSYLLIFISIAISTTKGVFYSFLIFIFIFAGVKYKEIKNKIKIPGIKDMFIAFGWCYMTTFIPAISCGKIGSKVFYLTFLFVFVVSTLRSVLISVFQKYNDMIISNENIYSAIGEEKTFMLINVLVFVILISSIMFYIKLNLFIIILPVYYILLIYALKKKKTPDILLSEFLTDLPFFVLILA
ncbi:MAG: 4-hydroxy-3-methylbut-2-enyl diphosphate reductase [Elusimicrobiota bacterium]